MTSFIWLLLLFHGSAINSTPSPVSTLSRSGSVHGADEKLVQKATVHLKSRYQVALEKIAIDPDTIDTKKCTVDERQLESKPTGQRTIIEGETIIPCSPEETDKLKKWIPPDYLPYIFDMSGAETYVAVDRKVPSGLKAASVHLQYKLATYKQGKIVVIYFPGTSNVDDMKIDLTVDHVAVTLPLLVRKDWMDDLEDKKRRKAAGEKIPKGKYSLLEEEMLLKQFRIHKGIHTRIYHKVFLESLCKDLINIYSGVGREFARLIFDEWVEHQNLTSIKSKIVDAGFSETLKARSNGHKRNLEWTKPSAMRLDSKEFIDVINDPGWSKTEIVKLVNAIKKIGKRNPYRPKITHLPDTFIISGHSLGGGYATYFFLRLYGDGTMRNRPGLHFLPKNMDAVTVIPIAAPNIVFWEDALKIDRSFGDRVFNIINFGDPVPAVATGHQMIKNKTVEFSIWSVMKNVQDKKLIKYGTNGPVGNYVEIYKCKRKIPAAKIETQEVVSIVIKDVWEAEDDIWLNFGSRCLWKRTWGGVFGAIPLAIKRHPMKRYKANIYKSCIGLYIRAESEYYKDRKRHFASNNQRLSLTGELAAKKAIAEKEKQLKYEREGKSVFGRVKRFFRRKGGSSAAISISNNMDDNDIEQQYYYAEFMDDNYDGYDDYYYDEYNNIEYYGEGNEDDDKDLEQKVTVPAKTINTVHTPFHNEHYNYNSYYFNGFYKIIASLLILIAICLCAFCIGSIAGCGTRVVYNNLELKDIIKHVAS